MIRTDADFISKEKYHSRTMFGGNREAAIVRDGEKCVRCGMTRFEHIERFGCDITVDHIDGHGSNTPAQLRNNELDNLQTLCLVCHGYKNVARRRPHVSARMQTICSVTSCNRIVGKNGARGYCGRHYTKWLRHGTPNVSYAGKDKTHCKHGHALAGHNVINRNGVVNGKIWHERVCRTCHYRRSKESLNKRKGE